MREPDRFVSGVSITPGKACTYQIPERWIVNGYPGGSKRTDRPPKSPEEKAAANTRRIISRYWQAVGWLWLRSKREIIDLGNGRKLPHRQGLLTLTLPGTSSADHRRIKHEILDPFLTYCRNVLGLRSYVWVAELQERGEIHFHAICNEFLPKDKVRAAWLRCCDRSGLVQGDRRKSRPATEIKECRSYKGSRSYAAKYLGKGLRSGAIIGRIWGGSQDVTGIGPISTNEVDQAFDAPAAIAEVSRITKGWRQHDHGIRTARFALERVTRRQSPVLHSLFRWHLRRHDQPPPPNVCPSDHTNALASGSSFKAAITAETSYGDPAGRSFVGGSLSYAAISRRSSSGSPRDRRDQMALGPAISKAVVQCNLWSVDQ